tara:strand:+ start:279 stop:1934 length:1656 start_codon:yes stop_codon:yes gene_type:complete
MSRTVTIDLDVNDAQAVRAWQRGKQAIAEFDKTGAKAGKTFGGMFASTTKAIAGAAAGFAGVGSVLGGILLAANQLRAEWANITQQQAAAAQSNLTFEQSLAKAIRNASGIFEAADVRKRSLALAAEANISPAKAAGIIGAAVTSRGVQNAADAEGAIDSASAAAVFAPDLDATGSEGLAGVAASGSKRFGVTPEQFIGNVQRIGIQSNVRELPALIQNVAPAVSNLDDLGFSGKRSAAGGLVATMTQGIEDDTGEVSATAAINLAKALRDRFGKQKQFQNADGSFDALAAITEIQGDIGLRDKFIEGGKFNGKKFGKAALGKGKAFSTIEQLLTGGSFRAQQFAGASREIGGFEAGGETFRDLVTAIETQTPTEQLKRLLESGTAGVQANDVTGISSIIREDGKKFQQSLGDSAIGQRFSGFQREFDSDLGYDPVAAINSYQRQLTRAEGELRRGKIKSKASPIVGPYGAEIGRTEEIRRPATTREIELADRLGAQVEKLEKIEQIVKVQVNINQRPANASIKAVHDDRKHARLNSNTNVQPGPARGGRR